MEITWYGLTCFRLSERGMANVVTDPYPPELGLEYTRPRGNIVTISRNTPECSYVSGVRGPSKILDGPGEYEIGGVFVTGVRTFADSKNGKVNGLNTIFMCDFDGLTICHLGLLGHVPTQSQVEDLGTVDVLLLPVGGGGALTPAKASEVISLFEPSIVIPMYYKIPGLELDAKLGTLNRFLKEMGLDEVETEERFKVTSSSLSDETQVVVLEPSAEKV